MNEQKRNNIMLFGSFDGLHRGHDFLINKAQTFGERLVIVVAHDITIKNIKKQTPVFNLEQRIQNIQDMYTETTVIPGDRVIGTWSPIHTYQPHTIIVGYDQNELKKALEDIQKHYKFKIIQIEPFHPQKYKSSLLRKNKNPI